MQEKNLAAVIFTVNVVVTSLAATALFLDESSQGSMIIYNFCMSREVLHKYANPTPIFRILECISVLASLLGKVFLYIKMWTRISLKARRPLPEESVGICRELSGMDSLVKS